MCWTCSRQWQQARWGNAAHNGCGGLVSCFPRVPGAEVAAAGQVVLPACQLRPIICLSISMPRHVAPPALMQESGASEAELAALKKRKLVAAESWKTYRVRLLKPCFALHQRSGC